MPVTITNVNTPDVVRKLAYPTAFKFDTMTHPDYDMLLDDMLPQIDAMYGTGWRDLETWDKAVKLRNFIRRWADKGWYDPPPVYTGAKYEVEQVYIPEILAWEAAGNEGFCSWYSTIYMHLCLRLGIHVRRVGWRTQAGGGDQITEVYHPEWRKWVWVSPLFNRWYTDINSNGVGLSTIELHKHYHAGTLDQVVSMHDGYPVEPAVTPEYDYNEWILDHCYTIQLFNADGYRFSNGEWSKLTYTDASVHPLEGAFTQNVSTTTAVWHYDVGVSKISADEVDGAINIAVEDYHTPNFKHFEYKVKKKNDEDVYEELQTSTTAQSAFSVATTEPGDYEVEVYTVNQHNGKGTVSTVEYTVAMEGKYTPGMLKVWTGDRWAVTSTINVIN